MQIKGSLVLTIIAATLAAPVALADDASGEKAARTTVVDFKGRPPFSRQRVSTETASLARFEETKTAPSVRFRGRPPFSRHTSPASSADFARFEETAESSAPRRMGPPGKMNSRRHL